MGTGVIFSDSMSWASLKLFVEIKLKKQKIIFLLGLASGVLRQYGHGLADLLLQQVRVGGEIKHGKELGVLNLEQHTGDFAGHVGVHGLKVKRLIPLCSVYYKWCRRLCK